MLSEENKKKIIELLTQGIKHHQNVVEIVQTNPRIFFEDIDKRPLKFIQSISDAKKCYNEVLRIDKNNYDALRHLGILELDQENTKEATKTN